MSDEINEFEETDDNEIVAGLLKLGSEYLTNMNETNAKTEIHRIEAQERIAKSNNDVKIKAIETQAQSDKRDTIIAVLVVLSIIGTTVYLSVVDKLTPALALILGGAFTTFGAKFFNKFIK